MRKYLLIYIQIFSFVLAQGLIPDGFSLGKKPSPKINTGLKSNIISEVRVQGSPHRVWLGTGRGVAVVEDSSSVLAIDSLRMLGNAIHVQEMGVSAIGINGKKVFFSIAGDNGEYPKGEGLYFSTNADSLDQIIWNFREQSKDSQNDTLAIFSPGKIRVLPVTTATANVTYDIAVTDDYLWTANWAGGLRRLPLSDSTGSGIWDRVPLPEDGSLELITCDESNYESIGGNDILKDFKLNPRDPIDGGNNNHKVFSVIAAGDTIWVGTANGINRGLIGKEGCIDWEHYSFPDAGLSGNFVVDLEIQSWKGTKTVWAATVFADNPSEQSGVSYTRDDGLTWNTALLGERVYNIFSSDSLIFAASANGVWKSTNGITWALYKPAKSSANSDKIMSNIVYSGQVDTPPYYTNKIVWLGTADGLARSIDLQGSDWTVFRAEFDPEDVYAFPNPFIPGDGSVVRFHTDNRNSEVIEMTIYNFAMSRVFKNKTNVNTGSRFPTWDGKDDNGLTVANGIYFAKLVYDNKAEWAKVIVVK